MGTLLKYLLYALIIIVIYLLGVGFYEGTFNKDSTVGEISSDVAQGTKRIIRDGYDSTKETVKDGYEATKDKIEEYENDRKEEKTMPQLEETPDSEMKNTSSSPTSATGGFVEN